MRIEFDTAFPKSLVQTVQMLHSYPIGNKYQIGQWGKDDQTTDIKSKAVFIFDKSKKDIDVLTQKHFEDGYRVFAFKIPEGKHEPFHLTLAVLTVWRAVLEAVETNLEPFVYTLTLSRGKLKKLR